MARRAARRSNVRQHDFTGVDLESGGGFHIPPGEYRMAVESVEEATSKAGNDQYEWKFKGLEGKAKGKIFYLYTTWTAESLWKLGQTLVALGYDVPDGPMDVDLDELPGTECIGDVQDNEYNGKIRSRLEGVMAAEGNGKSSSRASKENGGDEKIDESEVKAMTEDELGDLIKEHKLKVNLRSEKTMRRKAQAVVEALDEKGLLAS